MYSHFIFLILQLSQDPCNLRFFEPGGGGASGIAESIEPDGNTVFSGIAWDAKTVQERCEAVLEADVLGSADLRTLRM